MSFLITPKNDYTSIDFTCQQKIFLTSVFFYRIITTAKQKGDTNKMTKQEVLDAYHNELDEIAAECAAEGYPDHGSNYELRIEGLWQDYYEYDYDHATD